MNYRLTHDKYLADDELKSVNKLIHTYNNRDIAILALAVHTGARASELLLVQASDLDHETKSVYIRGLKSSRDRWIPLHDNIFNLVKGYIPFDISYRRLHQIWDYYKPMDKTFHSIRHTFAVNLYKRTKDIKLVQIALGHVNITNTMIYVDYVMSKEELRRIL